MFCYQENTHFSQALPCTKEAFWEQVKKQTTAWRINARRAILAAVEASKTEKPQRQRALPPCSHGSAAPNIRSSI